MFDTYEPFLNLMMQSFTFLPKRYEIWQKGNLIKEGNTFLPITANVIKQDSSSTQTRINIIDTNLHGDICEMHFYDLFITLNDRLQLMTIPEITNSDCIGMSSIRMVMGSTREVKNFLQNEPYCCNLFRKNDTLVKLSFVFNNPEKLIEFYMDGLKENNQTIIIAKVIIEQLIENYDSDLTTIYEKELKSILKETYHIEVTGEEFIDALKIINNVYPQNNNVVEKDFGSMFMGLFYKTTYDKNSLRLVLNQIESMI